MTGYTIFAIVATIIAILLLAVIKMYNGLVVLKNRVDNQGAQVEVQLKRRADLIPNLIETTKGYANYEKGTLTAVTELRSKVLHASNTSEAYQMNAQLSREVSKIMAVSENYPELKANTNFLRLQQELLETEDKIVKARQFYNDIVTKYNTAIMVFPRSIFAAMFGFGKKQLLEATVQERESIKIDENTFRF